MIRVSCSLTIWPRHQSGLSGHCKRFTWGPLDYTQVLSYVITYLYFLKGYVIIFKMYINSSILINSIKKKNFVSQIRDVKFNLCLFTLKIEWCFVLIINSNQRRANVINLKWFFFFFLRNPTLFLEYSNLKWKIMNNPRIL